MTVEFKTSGDASSIMEKVLELRQASLVQGVDFDFTYTRIPQHAVFKFYTEKQATFYMLKWL